MARHETVKYTCDRCGVDMNKAYRQLQFIKNESRLFKPETWGKESNSYYDLCETCFDEFCIWVRG